MSPKPTTIWQHEDDPSERRAESDSRLDVKALADRRRSARHDARQHVAIVTNASRLVCDLIDISDSGAKLQIVDGAVPSEGENLVLVLIDGTYAPATVTWVGSKGFGIAFETPLDEIDAHLEAESLGQGYFSRAVQLQKLLNTKR